MRAGGCRRRGGQRSFIKGIAVMGLFVSTVGAFAIAMDAPPERRKAAKPAAAAVCAAAPTNEPKTVEETPAGQQEGKDLGWSADDEYMAAKMAMAEAEGEDIEGKALVILVIWNRTQSDKFPATVLEVISQKNAFTPYENGRYDRVEPDTECWSALDLIQAGGWDGSQGALYFERTPEDGESTWHSRNLERLFIHGNHTFYTEKEAKDP